MNNDKQHISDTASVTGELNSASTICCRSSTIDNMIDRTTCIPIEEHCNQVIHRDTRSGWCFNRIIELHSICEETVDANPVPDVRSHAVGNFIRGVPVLAVLSPLALARNVVRNLRLIKVDTPAISIPQRLKSLEMFNK